MKYLILSALLFQGCVLASLWEDDARYQFSNTSEISIHSLRLHKERILLQDLAPQSKSKVVTLDELGVFSLEIQYSAAGCDSCWQSVGDLEVKGGSRVISFALENHKWLIK